MCINSTDFEPQKRKTRPRQRNTVDIRRLLISSSDSKLTFSASETAPNALIARRSRLAMISYAAADRFYAITQIPRTFLWPYCFICTLSLLVLHHTFSDSLAVKMKTSPATAKPVLLSLNKLRGAELYVPTRKSQRTSSLAWRQNRPLARRPR